MQLLSSLVFLAAASISALFVVGAIKKTEICEKCTISETVEPMVSIPGVEESAVSVVEDTSVIISEAPTMPIVEETAESSASTTDTGPSTDVVETAVEKTTKFSDSTTETSPFETSTAGSPPLETISLELDDVELPADTMMIKIDGKAAMSLIVLTPPHDKWAYVSLKATSIPPLGSLVKFAASLKVTTMDRRREPAMKEGKTGSHLRIRVNGKVVYDKELVTTSGKFQKVTSDAFPSSENPRIYIMQKNGAKVVSLTVKDPALVFKSEINNTGSPKSTSTDSVLRATDSGPTAADSVDRGAQLSKAWIAGPVIGGCVGLAFVVGVIFFIRKRPTRRTGPHDTEGADGLYKKPELHADCIPQASRDVEGQVVCEMQGSIPQPSEIAANEVPV